MVEVVNAKEEHRPGILKLLRDLDNGRIGENNWARCLNNPFDAKEKSPGYVLLDKDMVVGFFGTIYSSRKIGGKNLNFCNTHSWIVLPEYRSKGLMLLSKIQKLKGYVLTNFSASSGPYVIFKKMGWKENKVENSIILNKPGWRKKNYADVYFYKDDDCRHMLSEDEKHIYDQHRDYNCHINVLAKKAGYSMNVFKSVPYVPGLIRKFKLSGLIKLNLGQLHFVSDPDIFFSNFEQSFSRLTKAYGWTGLIIPNTFCQQYQLKMDRPYMKKRPVLYRTDLAFNTQDIDLLFSEVFVLDLT